jgi:hypothetical protein
MRTENEWRNDAISQGKSAIYMWFITRDMHIVLRHFFLTGSNQYSEYSEETEMYWVEFTAIFDQRRKSVLVLHISQFLSTSKNSKKRYFG